MRFVNVLQSMTSFYSNTFLTSESDGSVTLILNLNKLNEFMHADRFKLEDLKVASRLISKDCYMTRIDLLDARHLINVYKDYRKYLRFQFDGLLYEFTYVPFRLCTAPLVFTKIMKPPLYFLRNQSLLSSVYIDNFILFGDSSNSLEQNTQISK